MIFHSVDVKGCTTEVTLCPIGDIQWNGDENEVWLSGLKSHLKTCLESPHPLFIGMGDYIDFASPSNRARIIGSQLYKGPRDAFQRQAKTLVREVRDLLAGTKGKWIGLLSGHHLWEFDSDTDGRNSDIMLARLLDAPYLGFGGAVCRIRFLNNGRRNHRDVWIWAHHGCGGGQKSYSPLTKLETVASSYEGIDIFLMGHHTKKAHVPMQKMSPVIKWDGTMQFSHRDVHLVGTGGWSKGYMESTVKRVEEPSYVEKRLMNPVALGAPIIHIRPKWQGCSRYRTWTPNIKTEV